MLDIDDWKNKIQAGDRVVLAKAISLVESDREDHKLDSQKLLTALLNQSKDTLRIGISGIPGVGKSTLIERLGLHILASDKKAQVAVLSIDPSSPISGGSILADKTRMQNLAIHERAFVRPSANRAYWGGVSEASFEVIKLMEAASYNYVIVETVGVGQNEYLVSDLVDVFLVLHMPKTGDGYQDIKKGIFELADIFAINKADGELLNDAKVAKHSLSQSLSLSHRNTPVLLVSALEGTGVAQLWEAISDITKAKKQDHTFEKRRIAQSQTTMDRHLMGRLKAFLQNSPNYKKEEQKILTKLKSQKIDPLKAADEIIVNCLKYL